MAFPDHGNYSMDRIFAPTTMRLWALMSISFLGGLLLHAPVNAEEVDPDKAAAVKTAYLYNLFKFVTWPEKKFKSSDALLVIGFVGDRKMAQIFRKVTRDKSAQDRQLEIKEFESKSMEDQVGELSKCHILFIPQSEENQIQKILPKLADAHVLTVSDGDGFCAHGGMVDLKLKSGRYVLRIQLKRVQQAKLNISSKMLRLAEIAE